MAGSPGRADRTRCLSVAFVGQSVYFEHCSLELSVCGLDPSFIDFRAGARPARLLGELRIIDPDAILVFRPEIIPQGLFDSLRALTIGYLTEPLPRSSADQHSDLRFRLNALEQVHGGNFDRVVAFDPLIAETAARVVPVWRSVPIPVADRLFMDVTARARPPRLTFLGRSTEHRETLLAPIKRSHHIVHIGHGIFGAPLERLLRDTDVQLNLHNNPYPTFENRVSIALAAGHLVISEPLSPDHGLQAGRDYLEAHDPVTLRNLVEELTSDPSKYVDVQRAGREQAERFRASQVYPALIRDAIADVSERGSHRGHP